MKARTNQIIVVSLFQHLEYDDITELNHPYTEYYSDQQRKKGIDVHQTCVRGKQTEHFLEYIQWNLNVNLLFIVSHQLKTI